MLFVVMHLKVTVIAWLLAIIFISQTMCQDKASGDAHGGSGSSDSHGSGGGGGSSGGGGGGSGGGGGGGSGGGSGGGGGGDSHGSSGNKNTGMDNVAFNMNGMSGIQLPFPFFPPFGCDLTCQPMQLQIFQPQQVQPTETRPTTHAPTTHAPTTMPPPKTTTPSHKPSPTTSSTYTSQTIVMYPNWCQGWCRFFYQPPPQPVYYQPNCLLFSWMGMGSGMSMGMQTA